nr:MAG TPA: hypothetical protein [Caudoviricetes sp.]
MGATTPPLFSRYQKPVPVCPFFHATIKLGLLVLRSQRLFAGGGDMEIISAAATPRKGFPHDAEGDVC